MTITCYNAGNCTHVRRLHVPQPFNLAVLTNYLLLLQFWTETPPILQAALPGSWAISSHLSLLLTSPFSSFRVPTTVSKKKTVSWGQVLCSVALKLTDVSQQPAQSVFWEDTVSFFWESAIIDHIRRRHIRKNVTSLFFSLFQASALQQVGPRINLALLLIMPCRRSKTCYCEGINNMLN